MHPIKILILEDHALTRHMLVLALRGAGYNQLHCAESGEQAFALLRSERFFDVLISDIQMDGVDGLTFLRQARDVGSISALITATVIANDLRLAIHQLARLAGYQVLGDLGKPFSRDELSGLLQHYRPAKTIADPARVLPDLSEADVMQALANHEFIPFFQPKVDLKTLRVVGAEALVRWQHPRLGLLAPGVFLEQVIGIGVLHAMTQCVIRQALRFVRALEGTEPFYLSINLDIAQLALPDLVEDIRRLLVSERVPAQQLILEITETGLMQAPITSIENLVRLRLLGCGVSIDDFGAGFSSVQRVCEMPCTELKLDASFAGSLAYNPRSRMAVSSVLHLAHQLGITLVAEGIETATQLVLLQELGCPVGQGYYFSPPRTADAFIEWAQQHKTHCLTCPEGVL